MKTILQRMVARNYGKYYTNSIAKDVMNRNGGYRHGNYEGHDNRRYLKSKP